MNEFQKRYLFLLARGARTNDRKTKAIKKAAEPLVEFLRKEETPMTTAIVTGVGVEVVSTDYHVPFDEYPDD